MPKTKTQKAPKSNSTSKAAQPDQDPVSLILPYLYIGPYSATSATSTFIPRKGITHVISVGRRPNATLDNVTYLRLSIEDDPTADLRKAGKEAAAFIAKARSGKKSSNILVHCSAGISRSPAVVAFYLMQQCDMSLKRALGTVIRARPNACPNPGFVSQLLCAELDMKGSNSLPADLASLPIKKEERLALFEEVDGPQGDIPQADGKTPLVPEDNKENLLDNRE